MTRHEFLKNFNTQYHWLVRNNPKLLDKIFPLKQKYWDLESCKLDALKYKTRNEWNKNSNSAYRTAHRNKWLDECCYHMTSYKWTLESCKLDALKYNTRSEWYKNSIGRYEAARRNKWMDVCCSHMELCKYGRKLVINLDTKQIFESLLKAAESVKCSGSAISFAIKKTQKCKGYHWAYCDEKGNIIK